MLVIVINANEIESLVNYAHKLIKSITILLNV
jgi:hypothetical protein